MKILLKDKSSRQNAKWLIMFLTGILFLTTVGIVYIPYFVKNGMHELELTFLSNTIAGFLFLSGGIYGIIKKKDFPQAFYMDTILVLQLVFIICMVFIDEFNFSGGFIFLHIINPVIATIELLLFSSCSRKPTLKSILMALIFPYIYLFYVIIYGYLSESWIYGILNFPDRGIVSVLLLVVIAGIGIIILEWIQYTISFYISQKGLIKN